MTLYLPCPTCEQSGEIAWNPSRSGDPQCVQTAPCPTCDATGCIDASTLNEATAEAFERPAVAMNPPGDWTSQ